MGKSLYDVLQCPRCGSEDCYTYDVDDVEFEHTGKGHYYVNCRCKECNHDFRLYMHFTYIVTSATTSK